MAVTGAGLEGIIAAESRDLLHRRRGGHPQLSGLRHPDVGRTTATFEEVIFLLWNGRLPKQAELDELQAPDWWPTARSRAGRGIPEGRCQRRSPMAVLRTAVSMLALYDPLAQDMSPEANTEQGAEADGADRDDRHLLRPAAQRQIPWSRAIPSWASRRISCTR